MKPQSPSCLEIACCGAGQAGPKQLLSTSECSVLDVQCSAAQGSSCTGHVSGPLAFSFLLLKRSQSAHLDLGTMLATAVLKRGTCCSPEPGALAVTQPFPHTALRLSWGSAEGWGGDSPVKWGLLAAHPTPPGTTFTAGYELSGRSTPVPS